MYKKRIATSEREYQYSRHIISIHGNYSLTHSRVCQLSIGELSSKSSWNRPLTLIELDDEEDEDEDDWSCVSKLFLDDVESSLDGGWAGWVPPFTEGIDCVARIADPPAINRLDLLISASSFLFSSGGGSLGLRDEVRSQHITMNIAKRNWLRIRLEILTFQLIYCSNGMHCTSA